MSVADSRGLVSSAMASPIAESVRLAPSESPEKANAESIPEKNEPNVASANEPPATPGTGVQGDNIHRSSNQNPYWSKRYNRLHTYLENCDRSSQEGYMRSKTFLWQYIRTLYFFSLTVLTCSPSLVLRLLSATGRSMHAIELEKRAIHLIVEEGDTPLAKFCLYLTVLSCCIFMPQNFSGLIWW
jgi:hypothetical protein